MIIDLFLCDSGVPMRRKEEINTNLCDSDRFFDALWSNVTVRFKKVIRFVPRCIGEEVDASPRVGRMKNGLNGIFFRPDADTDPAGAR